MNRVAALLLVSLAFAACSKKPEPAPEPVATPIPATPTPKPVAVATPDPTPSYLAPEGVYFLTAAASATTDEGIVGVRPGTQLKKVGEGEYITKDGLKLVLPDKQVTNDLRVVQQVIGQDQAAQASLREWKAQQEALAAQNAAAQNAVVESAPARAASARPYSISSGQLGATHSKTDFGDGWRGNRKPAAAPKQ